MNRCSIRIITHQRFCDYFFARFDTVVAKFGESKRVALAAQNCIDDRQSGQTGNVADHVMQLQVHLIQRFLHVVRVRGAHLHQALPVPKQRTDGADFLFRTIRGTQPADRMQELKPLGRGPLATEDNATMFVGALVHCLLE